MTGSDRPAQQVTGHAAPAAPREGAAAEISKLSEALARAERRRRAERDRANILEARITVMEINLAEAERAHNKVTARAEVAEGQLAAFRRADAERKARGLLGRLRDALLGE